MSNPSYHISDDLLVKYLLGECTPEEQDAIRQWTDANADNRKYYEQLKLIWNLSKGLAASKQADENKAWRRFQQRIHQPEQPSLSIKRFKWLRIAAMVLIIAGACGLALTLIFDSPAQEISLASKESIVTDTLPDGSVITLNKRSNLTYPGKFKGDKRLVSLQGEAFFTVTPDRNKPFIIQSDKVVITVVGTSFNVRNQNNTTEVIVETGIVKVSQGKKSVQLMPGDKATINQDDAVIVKNKQQDKLYNYYRTREFVCDNTPLWKLVYTLNEAYDAQIEIDNPQIRNLPINTTFNNESLDRILEIVRLTFNISVTRAGDKIILR